MAAWRPRRCARTTLSPRRRTPCHRRDARRFECAVPLALVAGQARSSISRFQLDSRLERSGRPSRPTSSRPRTRPRRDHLRASRRVPLDLRVAEVERSPWSRRRSSGSTDLDVLLRHRPLSIAREPRPPLTQWWRALSARSDPAARRLHRGEVTRQSVTRRFRCPERHDKPRTPSRSAAARRGLERRWRSPPTFIPTDRGFRIRTRRVGHRGTAARQYWPLPGPLLLPLPPLSSSPPPPLSSSVVVVVSVPVVVVVPLASAFSSPAEPLVSSAFSLPPPLGWMTVVVVSSPPHAEIPIASPDPDRRRRHDDRCPLHPAPFARVQVRADPTGVSRDEPSHPFGDDPAARPASTPAAYRWTGRARRASSPRLDRGVAPGANPGAASLPADGRLRGGAGQRRPPPGRVLACRSRRTAVLGPRVGSPARSASGSPGRRRSTSDDLRPQPLPLAGIGHTRVHLQVLRAHLDGGVWIRAQVVEPGRVLRVAALRGHDHDVVAVPDVAQRARALGSALGPHVVEQQVRRLAR